MTTVFSETFYQGAAGDLLTTSNTTFGTITGASVFAASAPTGAFSPLSALFSTTTTMTALESFSGGLTSNVYYTMYVKVTAFPSVTTIIAHLRAAGVARHQLRITNTGTLQLRNNVTAVATSVATLTAGQWARLDWQVLNGTTQTLKIFLGANINGAVADETISGASTTGTMDECQWGVTTAATVDLYLAGIVHSDSALPGAFVSPRPAINNSKLGMIGDSLTYQAGPGAANLTSLLVTSGWSSSNITINGLIGRSIINGASSSQSVLDAWWLAGLNPKYIIIALGANNKNATDANWNSYINALLNYIGTGHTIYWVNQGFQDATDSRVLAFNTRLNTIAAGRADLFPLDWNTAAPHSIVADWLAGDPDGVHMVTAGYVVRNAFITSGVQGSAPVVPATSGSIQAELNRLANGGTNYRTGSNIKSINAAANEWAGTTGKNAVAALNSKNGVTNPNAFLDFQGVCNALAGTTGLGPPDALRHIAS